MTTAARECGRFLCLRRFDEEAYSVIEEAQHGFFQYAARSREGGFD
jgi:hypothetical protein